MSTWRTNRNHGTLGGEDIFKIKGYALVNARIGVAKIDDTIQVSLFARNLFNKNYWTNTDTLIDFIFRIPGSPRRFGISLTLRTQ